MLLPSSSPHPDLVRLRPLRICLIKPSALGDVVNAFPTLGALKSLWPEARFSWVVNQGLRGLVDGHPQIDEVIAYDRGSGGRRLDRLKHLGSMHRELRNGRFDVAVDLQGLLRSGLMTAATGAPVRVGLSDAREGATWFYTHRIVPPGPREGAQAVDRLLAIARAFGADVSEPRARVAISEADREWARRALSGVPRPRLALNLGARWETKRWPPSHFAEIARRAVRLRSAGLLAVGATEDRPFVDELIARLAPLPVADFCGGTSLPQLAALAELSDVVISNDTGPLHLAAATGTRVVGVYTCTSPDLNGPFGRHTATVRSRVDCAGSYHVRCPHAFQCMDELDAERVWPVVLSQFDRPSARCDGVTAA
jgi:lipopolysaccharide heptosyltransferase II